LSIALKNDPKLEITLNFSCQNLPEVESYNVIGEIRGNKYPDEVIVVGGHLDAWDKGEGAHDNGAGCMQSIEVLYLIKKLGLQPSRTIRCVLFIDEEQHQTGAKSYGYYASYTSEKHLAAIESDRGGFTPRGFNVTADSSVIKKMQSWLPYLKNASIDWIKEGGSGPDIAQIKNATALIGYVPDGQRYFDFHHSANDVFEEINPRELELGSAAMTILAYLISEEGL
jgi:acetylornithine deacetylase/succinyl-diaminopimelate desuccinylase-like protein